MKHLNAILLITGLSFSMACEKFDPKDFPDLKIKTLRQGKGKNPVESSDTVVVHYVGKLKDGQIFDSSYKRKKPSRFPMNSLTLLKGWKIGILGMKKGEIRRLTIPPELAYGKSGKGTKIPPNATLTFDIELIKLQ